MQKIKNFFQLLICLFILLLQINSQISNALPMENFQNELITEELRIKVPFDFKDVWLEAEKQFWEPWLSQKDGFMGRQIFWDPKKEEALILINWKNKKLWKNISIQEVNELQEKYEKNVKTSLNLNQNPFKLISEGELLKQE